MSDSNDRPEQPDDLAAATRRRGSIVQTVKAVAWSFLGIRRGRDHEQDIQNLNPIHVIITGIVAALVFIAVLIAAVNWVTHTGAATT